MTSKHKADITFESVAKTLIFPIVLCGRETWSATLRVEHRLRVFENRVWRNIHLSKRAEVVGGENCIMRSSMIFSSHHILLGDHIKEDVIT
jgi:hypothetical protein